MAAVHQTEKRNSPEVVAGRYHVEARLGSGGMGIVYRVYDKVADKKVALKLLSEKASQSRTVSSLFEREFYTLAQLVHPRIIEVYDFGVDEAGAYYTMELLDGKDFRKLAPLHWKEACKLLRDVASSLALLHSRRLLHRDISTRNVRCTEDGRAKLIDGGAMVPFGAPTKLIGTPRFVSPEAFNLQPLDQRSDLYSLGALAYWLITNQHAYRARRLAQLPDAWRSQPKPLSVLNPDIPKTLNDLVMSLLNLDRMARPFSAAEVVETLSAVAGLEPDDTVDVAKSYLTTPSLCGRDDLVVTLRKQMLHTVGGYVGNTILFEGPSGIGRSRILAELVLEGKVVGAIVLKAGADDSNRADYVVVKALVRQLFQNAPDLALRTVQPYFHVLSPLLPTKMKRILLDSRMKGRKSWSGDDSLHLSTKGNESCFSTNYDENVDNKPSEQESIDQENIQEIRPQIQEALREWFINIGQKRCLVVAVDDIHRVDEPSSAFLSALAMVSRDTRLLLAATAESNATALAPVAFSLLYRLAKRIELGVLKPDATESLLRSVFGDVSHVRILADRIHKLSEGNPRAIMQLAQHLVDKGTVSYQSGTWTLPARLNENDLPGSLTEALRERVNALSIEERELAEAMALSSVKSFSFEECRDLSKHKMTSRLIHNLDKLISSEMLSTDGKRYTFSHQGWIKVLTDNIDEERKITLHLRLAHMFEKRDTEQFRVGQHLLHAGQEEKALDVFIDFSEKTRAMAVRDPGVYTELLQLLPADWYDTLNKAIALGEKRGRPLNQINIMQSRVSGIFGVTGSKHTDHTTRVLERYYRESGLVFYEEISDQVPASQRIALALKRAQQHYNSCLETERLLPPSDAIRALAATLIEAIGIVYISDSANFWRTLPSLKALVPLSPAIGIVEKCREAIGHCFAGRIEIFHHLYIEVLERLEQPDKARLEGAHYQWLRIAVIHAIAVVEAVMGLDSAKNRLLEIETFPLLQVNAWRIRKVYHLWQGESQEAEKCQQQVELLQIANSPTHYYRGTKLCAELKAYCIANDLPGIKLIMDDIEKMASEFQSWMPTLHYVRGEYHRIRGDFNSALQEQQEALRQSKPGEHQNWAFIASAYLNTLVALERHDEARTEGQKMLLSVERENLGYAGSYLKMSLALAKANLGDYENAIKDSQAVIDTFKTLGSTGLNLGYAYECRARIAIIMNDEEKFQKYARICAEQYRVGQNKALTAKYHKLIQDARQANLGMSEELRHAAQLDISLRKGGDVAANVRSRLLECRDNKELVDRTLDLVVKRTGSKWGYLYLVKDDKLELASQNTDVAPPEELIRELRGLFARFSGDEDVTDQSDVSTRSCFIKSCVSDIRALDPIILSIKEDEQIIPVGVVVVCRKEKTVSRPEYEFYETVARCIFESSEQTSIADISSEQREIIAENRYLVESILGEGGMGAVYKVRDTVTGKAIALKRVHSKSKGSTKQTRDPFHDAEQRGKLESFLRREYQTLQSLAHPCIIEVYDFGIDEQGPYYTMELLDGSELRELAPLQWKKACVLLRDLASSLALLHSRRMLHRDVSPRNVRLIADGQAKLIDLGAMTPMGLPGDKVGTPPFMSPEVIYGQPLDQRSDLYSLGALAYWLLSGRNAYPVKHSNQLRDAWRSRPLPPSSVVQEVPASLDRLIMSLLSQDPLARPASAFEVIERLSALAGIEVDEQLEVKQAYLTTPTLVGREKLLLKVRKRVIRTLRGRGGAIMVQGVEGVGRTRFLDACVLEGKLAGLVVLRADAMDAHEGDYAVVRRLVKQLLEEIPEIALNVVQPQLSILRHVIPVLDKAVKSITVTTIDSPEVEIDPKDLRPRVHAALSQWLLRISQQRAIMIAVDDAREIDEPSLSFLAILANQVSSNRLIVAATVRSSADGVSSTAIKVLSEVGTCIELKSIKADDTIDLLGSVFAGAPNTQLLAYGIHKLSEGNPRAIMQLAQHLVNKGTVCYQAGIWSLPDRLDENDLPRSLTDALRERVDALSVDARRLAEAMALSLEKDLSFEECRALSEHKDTSRLIKNLDELIASEILTTDGNHHTFSQRGWVKVLTENIDKAQERTLHFRLAQMFEKRGTEKFRVAQHLLSAGQEERALDIFIDFSDTSKKITIQNPEAYTDLLESLPHNWFETFTQAIRLAQQNNRSKKQIYILQRRLSGLSAMIGTLDTAHQTELLKQLSNDSGLSIYKELSDSVPSQERLRKAMELAQQQYDNSTESDRVLAPSEAIAELAKAIIETAHIIRTSDNYAFLQILPSVEPMVQLSPGIWVVHQLVQSLACCVKGCFEQHYEGHKKLIERLLQTDRAGLEETHHRYLLYGVLVGLYIVESSMGLKYNFDRISEVEKSPLLKVNSWRLRMLYYLWQSDYANAEQCLKQVEKLLVQNSPSHYYEGVHLYTELLAYCLSDDLLGVKQVTDDIGNMAERFPGWIPILHFAQGEYHRIRGDLSNALEMLQKAINRASPGRTKCWASLAGAYIKTLVALNRYQEARTRGREMIKSAEREELGYTCCYIGIPLALAEAKLGDHDNAVRRSEAVIDTFTSMGSTGLNLGYAYEYRARVAIIMNNEKSFQKYALLCAEQYRVGQHPALTAKYEKLVQEARNAGMGVVSDKKPDVECRDKDYVLPPQLIDISRSINDYRDSGQRAERVLELLMKHCNAISGYLFGLQEEGLKYLSGREVEQVPEELQKMVNAYIQAEIEESLMVTMTVADENAAAGQEIKITLSDGRTFEPVLLYSLDENRSIVVGLAALVPANGRLRAADPEFISAISDALLDTGDVVSVYAAA